MSTLPDTISLTYHAQQRLEERKQFVDYNTEDLMKSSREWYTKDDFNTNSNFYLHILYVCRKSPSLDYITDGIIEVIYNRDTNVAITVLEVKDKFLPVTQYLKPAVLSQKIEEKKENQKMRSEEKNIGTCPDCGETGVGITSQGICTSCRMRKNNSKSRGKEYIPVVNLSEEERARYFQYKEWQTHRADVKKKTVSNVTKNVIHATITPKTEETSFDFIETLKDCGCDIPDINLKEILNVLSATDKLKDILINITKNENQDALLDLEQALNAVERKLQHTWEFNGFKAEDDLKFKKFLTWRRNLKGNIYFWKKLYQTGTLLELQKAWDSYVADPADKVLLTGDRIESIQKRYQITTETVSTILNTRRPFTRVFYALSEEDACNQLTKWLSERQLHEDKRKTTIVELSSKGKDGRSI